MTDKIAANAEHIPPELLKAIRNEALEEAARVCDTHQGYENQAFKYRRIPHKNLCARSADVIRALKE